ncbi:MAG TPA: DUF2971 domain-containing protein [Terriglobia bacterium]|nr:DUF2971 domain-containing protein [Terriglobia bacterium]
MEDPYDCMPSPAEIKYHYGGVTEDPRENMRQGVVHHETLRKLVLVNCWHMNPTESAAMWKLYAPGKQGVAIDSTFGRLRDSFSAAKENVHIGEVKYADFSDQSSRLGNAFLHFLRKRRSFEHERELRALVYGTDVLDAETGLAITVDLATLIQTVFVAPVADAWFLKVVKSVAGKYEIDESKVSQSDLYQLTYPSEDAAKDLPTA